MIINIYHIFINIKGADFDFHKDTILIINKLDGPEYKPNTNYNENLIVSRGSSFSGFYSRKFSSLTKSGRRSFSYTNEKNNSRFLPFGARGYNLPKSDFKSK